MAKININSSLKGPDETYEYSGSGILKNNNTIIFKDKDITTTIKLNQYSVEILRRSDSYKLDLNFQQKTTTNGLYTLNNNNKLTLSIETNKIIYNNNQIEIEYKINEIGNFKYKLKYEVIE